MLTDEQRDYILKAADELRHAKAAYEAALARFDAVLDGRVVTSASQQKRKYIGKPVNPRSLTQRVLAALTANGGPMKLTVIAEQLKTTAKRVRNAIVYHQKNGRVIRVGEGMYDLKARENGGGQHTAQSDLNP